MSSAARALLALVAAAATAACTLGPEPARPATAADTARSYVNAPSGALGGELPSPWWTRFGDPTTAELVELALADNTDLRAAAARVLEADAAWTASRGSMWPQVNGSLSGNRTKTSFVLPEVGRKTIYSTTYSGSVSVAYQLDLFGKLKRTRQAAWAQLLAERAARETVVHSVVAAVVRARVQVATAERSLDLAKAIEASWQRTLNTTERRYEAGLVSAVDLHLARENLATTAADVDRLKVSLATARHGLDVLVGRRPGTSEPLPRTLPDLPDLAPVPPGLPASLLDRRPDLVQAEMRLAAATYGIGAALADLYPNLSLTGSGGTTSGSLSGLLKADSIVYNAVANVLGPIFAGGSRRAEVRAARARAEEAAASYSGLVLGALREVEDALVADGASRRLVALATTRLDEARAADTTARDRYQRGVESFLKVLETERRLRAAEEALVTTRAAAWNTRVDLFLALGGDWNPVDDGEAGPQNPKPTPVDEVAP